MSALLAGVAVLLALLVALLAVPIEAAFALRGGDRFGGQLRLRWLFGIVRWRVQFPRGGRRRAATATGAKAKRRRQARRRRGAGALAALREPAFRARLYRLLGDGLRALHLRQLHARIRVGLGDPADTGWLWGLLGPLGAAAESLPQVRLHLEPEFFEPVLEFDAAGRVRLVPLQALALAIGFALSPPSLRAWRALALRHG